MANLEPNRLPNGSQNEALETLLVSRGCLGGHGGGHKEVRKAVGNVVGSRHDFRSEAGPPRVGCHTSCVVVQALGFSNIRTSSSVFV